jgi:NAD(P)H dehydrogenase (quinone)
MTVAVTAASGQLGSAIVRALDALPDAGPVVALARTPDRAAQLGVEVRPGDYDDREQLVKSLQGVDTLLLVSGMDPPDKRIGQHRNVIEAARMAGVGKLVYTSVQGPESGTDFSPVVQSNRQTEADVRASGLAWVIGRNGIYIEPDIEYIDRYRAAGVVANCAGDGRCGYTTRPELGYAYARMLTDAAHDGRTYNLHGEPLTQAELVQHLNRACGTDLTYRPMSVADYRAERTGELGDFLGPIIAGIYQGILEGAYDNQSHYAEAAGRPHQGWDAYFAALGAGPDTA